MSLSRISSILGIFFKRLFLAHAVSDKNKFLFSTVQ
jgi:hypothetical protein